MTREPRRCTCPSPVAETHHRRSATWFWRNVLHVCDGGCGRRGISRATVRCEASNPSFSNSPWMRGAPQSGFASAMVRRDPQAPRRPVVCPLARGGTSKSRKRESSAGASEFPSAVLRHRGLRSTVSTTARATSRRRDRVARISLASICGGAGRAAAGALGSRA